MRTHNQARLRWRVKQGLAACITRLTARRTTGRRNRHGYRPLVLGYHRVVEHFEESARSDMASMLVSTAMFEQHLDWIGRHFRFVDLDTVGAAERNGVAFDEPVAAVTFDDGYEDIYEHALPVLKRKGIPAAAFVVTDLVGHSSWQHHDRQFRLLARGYERWQNPRRQLHGILSDLGLPAGDILCHRGATRTAFTAVSSLLPKLARGDVDRVMQYVEWNVGNGFAGMPRSMTWQMLQQLRHEGFTIGSHTRSHASLPMEPEASLVEELIGSKKALEQRLGATVDHFAYPGGQFTPAVVDALARSGYRYAYTACPHNDPRHPALTIERLLLWEGSSIDADGRFSEAILQCQAHDLWPPARHCQRAHA